MTWTTCFGILVLLFIAETNGKWVRDVDSSIIEEIQQNPSNAYLIMFHAPWCGHCRRFESTYEEIAREVKELTKTAEEFRNVHLVRLDATVYGDVANHYDIVGYPTLKFIRGSQVLSYENDRTKSSVLKFLKRANGPALRWISSVEKFEEIRQEHDVFFLLVTSETNRQQTDSVRNEYEKLVLQYLSQAYFYATNDSLIQETYLSQYSSNGESEVFVVKTEGIYLYESNEFHPNVEEFIIRENVAGFPQVATGNIRDLIMTKKILIIYAFEDQKKTDEETKRRDEWTAQIREYVLKHDSTDRDTFQFAWSTDLDLLSHIAVWTLNAPLFFLYDSNLHKYGLYSLSSISEQNLPLEPIIKHILSHSSEIIRYTGDNRWKRFLLPFWELYRTIVAMFIEAPTMTMFVIGLPASVLSIVCYCLFCLPNESAMDERQQFYRDMAEEVAQAEQMDIEPESDEQPKSLTDKKDD